MITALICSGSSGQIATISARSGGSSEMSILSCFGDFFDFVCKLVCKHCFGGVISSFISWFCEFAATVCKTVIRRFESGRRLSFLYNFNKELSERSIRHGIKGSYPAIFHFLEHLITTERIIYYRTEPSQAEHSSPSPPLGLLFMYTIKKAVPPAYDPKSNAGKFFT